MGQKLLLSLRNLGRRPFRTVVMISVFGVVVLLGTVIYGVTAGMLNYYVADINKFGVNQLLVQPGQVGIGQGGQQGGVAYPLTADDARAIQEHIPEVKYISPVLTGAVTLAGDNHQDNQTTYLYGVWPQVQEIHRLELAAGRFWPAGLSREAAGAIPAVLGYKVWHDYLPGRAQVGREIQVLVYRQGSGGGLEPQVYHLRVEGLLADTGTSLGVNFNELIYIPAAAVEDMLGGREGTILVASTYTWGQMGQVAEEIRRLLRRRHGGLEDFTVLTQEQLIQQVRTQMQEFNLFITTVRVATVFISGLVALMLALMSVYERTREIGLLRAVGAGRGDILRIFLGESLWLGLLGASLGAVLAWLALWVLGQAPGEMVGYLGSLPAEEFRRNVVQTGLSMVTLAVAAGIYPAWRAAALPPAEALRYE